MTGTRGLRRRTRIVWLAVVLLAALAVPSVATAVPSAPGIKDATVYQGGAGVTVWWTASTDVDAGPIQYAVYRDDVPMTIANYLANGELVTTTALTTVTVTPRADEVAKKFTYYYIAVATNTTTGLKSVSANVAPNVHGGLRSGMPTLNCQLCHGVHGVGAENYLGAATRYKCYRCHGNTDATKSYGDKALRNVQKDFYDYTAGQTIPAAVSRHYNQYMVDNETECTACHTPHKSPYYVNPTTALKEDANSYTQLLRVETAASTYFYSKDDSVAGNAFCFQCHGGNTTALDLNAGPGAYDRTAGDHNQAGYAANAAHGNAQVFPNADGHRTNPAVQCEACHNKHASPADKLIEYRNDDYVGATTTTYAQAELCYACHSAAGYAAEIAAGTATGNTNFAWNGRDVKAQFAKTSKHPTTARVGGPVATPASWSETSRSEFADDTLANAVATSAGSVELSPIYASGTIMSEAFTSGWGAWSTTGSYWTVAPGYANWQHTQITRQTGTLAYTLDLSAVPTDPTISFNMGATGLDVGEDYYIVQYSVDGGAWQDLVASSATARTWPAAMGPYTLTGAAGSDNVRLLFTASTLDNTTEWIRYDDVVITGMVSSGTYEVSGSVAAGPITPAGSLVTWDVLDFTENQPGGTNLTVDVLNAADDSVLLANAADGASLTGLSASSLKLRANLTGAAPTPRTAPDNFGDNSFDTSLWADVQLNSTDPDAAYSSTIGSITFATALINATTGMDSRSPDADGTGWYRVNNNGQDGTAGYARTGATEYDLERTMLKNFGDLSGASSVDAGFYWHNNNSTMTAGDYLYVEWTANGGSSWTTVGSVTSTTADGTWGQLSATGLPTGTNCQLRVRAKVQDAVNDEWLLDSITVTGNYPAGTAWPSETSGALTLRAEGSGFGRNSAGTAITDEGEFTYIKPAAADWVDTQDFDMVVRVPSYNNLAGNGWMKTGLMIRTGTTEANAYATNAAMVGLYVTDTNGVVFQSRTTAGGTASANTAGTGDAPVYLKLTRRGNVITGYQSTNGTTWTQVGSQTVTMSTFVLPGVSLTSTVNGSFSEATFDDFRITEAGITATATPALLDWTVSYTEYPAVTTGSLTCVNCHNVHSVQKGTAGTAWQIIRASLPSNTKTAASGTPTQFCLDCHDGTAPTTAANSATVLVPYTVEFSDKSANPFFPGWNKTVAGVDWSASAHNSTTITLIAGNIGCQTCHDPHASDNARLTAYSYDESNPGNVASNGQHTGTVARNNSSTYAEENLCYACHDQQSGGNCAGCHGTNLPTLNVKTPFAVTGATVSKHPVSTSGKHSDLESGVAGFGSANRHSECADCHDPHAAKAGVHTAGDSTAAPVLRGAWGVKPGYADHPSTWNHTGNWVAPLASSYIVERIDGQDADYEAYLCFKCHSAYSGQPFGVTTSSGTYTSTDVAMEFNPSNFSEHNVLGQTLGMETAFNVGGTQYTWTKPADAAFLKTGWTSNSQVTCTDCHSNTATTAARGPHGAASKWILDPAYSTEWKTTYLTGTNMSNTTNICAKCHQNLTSANGVHSEGDHQGTGDGNCNTCHIKIPHGWKRPRLLGYTSDDANYKTGHPNGGGLDGVSLSSKTYNNWDTPDCATSGGCDHGSHSYSGASW